MTPEQRLDRAERILLMTVKAGRRARSEWREKLNILITAHIAVEDEMRRLTMAQAELTRSQKLTDQALRAFLRRRKGESST